jgi:FkbM family methyltransferase
MIALKRIAAHLPRSVQHQMKRAYYAHQIRRGSFRTPEPEFDLLHQWVKPGSTAIDVGANIGHYTLRLAQLVGEQGRVIAFEPMPQTFRLLQHNVAVAACLANVTLYERAASDADRTVRMFQPTFSDSGLPDPYEASIRPDGETVVRAVRVDSLAYRNDVSLVKVDVEGHEYQALLGMRDLIERCHPVLIVEGDAQAVRTLLEAMGYRSAHLPGSPNTVWTHEVAP